MQLLDLLNHWFGAILQFAFPFFDNAQLVLCLADRPVRAMHRHLLSRSSLLNSRNPGAEKFGLGALQFTGPEFELPLPIVALIMLEPKFDMRHLARDFLQCRP